MILLYLHEMIQVVLQFVSIPDEDIVLGPLFSPMESPCALQRYAPKWYGGQGEEEERELSAHPQLLCGYYCSLCVVVAPAAAAFLNQHEEFGQRFYIFVYPLTMAPFPPSNFLC